MKKNFIFIIFIIILAFSAFAESRRITVKQSIRYSDGQYVELLSPQISKSKAIKTNKGNVLLKYDFFVEKSSTYYDIICFVIFSNKLEVLATGIDGAFVPDNFDEFIVKESRIVPIFKYDENNNALIIAMSGKKGNKSTLEFQLNVLTWSTDTLPIDINFYPKDRNVFWGKVKAGIKGFFIIPAITDYFLGEFDTNLFNNSNRNYTLLVKE